VRKTFCEESLATENDSAWSIILAGGEGKRISPIIERWLGFHKPKQYCTFVGKRSMFQHTLDRADNLSAPEHKATVIARSHKNEVLRQVENRSSGIIIEQPINRDTAPGIFLPLTYVRASDPGATVVIYPSDHFVYPETLFLDFVRSALHASKILKNQLILLCARPDRLELEYGWIVPGAKLGSVDGHYLRSVEQFHEKPDFGIARKAMSSGALWNTFVFVTQAGTLWQLGHRYCPEMMRQFERLFKAINTSDEKSVLESVYRKLPQCNFSADVLEHAVSNTAVLEMEGVLWCDWGRAERIATTLDAIGKKPAFPLELVNTDSSLKAKCA
jgi:mannose-1-phosphate guanylyltransferase